MDDKESVLTESESEKERELKADGVPMNDKEVILEKSRSENKGKDLFKEEQVVKAGNIAAITGLIVIILFLDVKSFIGLKWYYGYAEIAIISAMFATSFIVQSISEVRRRRMPYVNAISIIILVFVAIYCFISYIDELSSGRGFVFVGNMLLSVVIFAFGVAFSYVFKEIVLKAMGINDKEIILESEYEKEYEKEHWFMSAGKLIGKPILFLLIGLLVCVKWSAGFDQEYGGVACRFFVLAFFFWLHGEERRMYMPIVVLFTGFALFCCVMRFIRVWLLGG